MAVAKLLNLIALSSIALIALSYGAAPVSALSLDSHHLAGRSPSHAVLAKKRRSTNSKRCKARPVSSSVSSSVPVAKPTTTKAPATTTTKPATTKAATPTTTKAAATTAAAASSSGARKVGLGWPQDDNTALAQFVTSSVASVYTWSPWVPTNAKSLGIQPVPMLWGSKQTSDFSKLVKAGYANAVLGMNEPNQQGQSDMTPQAGAQLWQQYIQPLKSQGYALITPAPTNAASGKQWLQDFFSACSGCTFDGMALHWYGTSSDDFIAYMEDMYKAFNLHIWVTEYACENFGSGAQCSDADVWSFMTNTKTWMDSTYYIDRYFWFGAMQDMGNVNPLNQLMASSSGPNSLGQYYIS
ncbi:hypothetical protein C0991_005962 [Blastosporella zonata]|nr:hypothetical protein C0991_005962 [Blastosporella zonata]